MRQLLVGCFALSALAITACSGSNPASSTVGTSGSGTSGGSTTGGSAASSGATSGGNNCPQDTACQYDGHDGLCEGGSCSACQGPSDDGNCASAYNGAFLCLDGGCTPGNCRANTDCTLGQLCGLSVANYCAACASDGQCQSDGGYGAQTLCLAGSCTPGNCRTDADCTTGQICGLAAPNFCGPCSADGQCQADPTYGPGEICNTATGACITNGCMSNDNACLANATDFCCGKVCTPGNCCATPDCTGNNETCQRNTCTTCTLVSNGTYYVDPNGGDDSRGTGNSMSGGPCAFQSITRALQFIGTSPAPNTLVMVLNTASVGPHETFPITVPTNVTISGATPGSPTTVDLPANKTAFALASASSGLSNLLIDGAKQTGTTGVTVNTGSAASTSISGVTIQNMTGDGIDVVNSGVVTLGPGTVSENNGTDKIQSAGIQISGGQAIITVDNGSPAKFSVNSGPGIFVSAGGSVTIGTDQASLSPAAISESNIEAGLFILQTPGATVPQNTVYNLQALNSVTGNGIIIFGGSTLELRKSQMGGNLESGILVETYTNGAAKSDDVSKIDLGTSSSAGGNTFQYADGGTFKPNGGAGICLDLSSNAGQTLSAQGDIFGTDDCATTASALTMSISCSGGVDIAILRSGSTDAINASLCTQ